MAWTWSNFDSYKPKIEFSDTNLNSENLQFNASVIIRAKVKIIENISMLWPCTAEDTSWL